MGTSEVLGGPRWTRFGPNGPQLVRLSWTHIHHTLLPGIGPFLGPWGSQKGPFWAEMSLLGAPVVLGGPRGAKFDPNCPRLVRLGWTHAHHTLLPGIGPLLSPWGSQKGSVWTEMPLLGAPGVLAGPRGAKFDPTCPRLVRLGWTHAHHTL